MSTTSDAPAPTRPHTLADPPRKRTDTASARRSHDQLDEGTAGRLRRWNVIAGLAHLASGAVFLAIVNDFQLPITSSFATEDPALLVGAPPTEVLTDVTVGYGVAAFSLLSAFFHLLVATGANRSYNRRIAIGQNPYRWVEYSLSSTLMILLIVMLLGAYDVGTLIAVAGANVAMILFGWVMERINRAGSGDVDWAPFVFGSIVGLVPWAVAGTYFAGALGNADEAVPAWVWGVFFSVFALFNCFAVNQLLQYKGVGKWCRYVFGEGVYIALSLIAKTALMWQVYFGTVR